MNIDMRKEPNFEETYPKAPFSELIRLTVALAAVLAKAASRLGALSWPRLNGRRKHPASVARR